MTKLNRECRDKAFLCDNILVHLFLDDDDLARQIDDEVIRTALLPQPRGRPTSRIVLFSHVIVEDFRGFKQIQHFIRHNNIILSEDYVVGGKIVRKSAVKVNVVDNTKCLCRLQDHFPVGEQILK